MTISDLEKDSVKPKWVWVKNIIKDMCSQNNRVFTTKEVKKEFEKRFLENRNPYKVSSDIGDDISMMSVNSPSRLSHLSIYGKPNFKKKGKYPRISSPENERDFLYWLGKGQYEIYEPEKHGVWEIVLDADDVNHLCRVEDEATKCQLIFDSQVRLSIESSSASRLARLAKSESIPERQTVTTSIFKRNPDVVAEILCRAMGICENCKNKAPFNKKSDGEPYLEVHHIIPLSEGGDDTVENAIALCPNCHRQRHFG
jgi:5-methylcytosine-specific restriction endonuclease McrA